MASERERVKENARLSSPYAREQTDLDAALISRENTAASSFSSVRPKFDIKSKSTLKSILTEYGLPDEEIKRLKELTKQRKKQITLARMDEQDDENTESYIEVYDDVYTGKEPVIEDFMAKLIIKVDHQRKMIQAKSVALKNSLSERVVKQKQQQIPQKKKKKSRVDVVHHDSFVKHLPKSQFYKLVSIEDRLKAKGILKSQVDMDEFWKSIQDPEVLKRYTKCALSETNADPKDVPNSSSFTSIKTKTERDGMEQRPLTHISEGPESTRPNTRDDRAVKSPQGPRKSPVKRKDPYAIARAAAQDLETKCPMVELPPMACFHMDLGERHQDPNKVLSNMQAVTREKERLLFVRRIRKMYNIAQSNTAATRRILEKHCDELDVWYGGTSTVTFMSTKVEKPEKLMSPIPAKTYYTENVLSSDTSVRQPWLKHLRHRQILPIQEVPEESSGLLSKLQSFNKKKSSAEHQDVHSERQMASRTRKQQYERPTTPPALCLDSLEEHSKVVDAKCLSTLWPNYTGGCKSLFAK